ncbi:MAG: hypothetical protein Q7T74_05215, partial [Candidatus Saccharibacteria bacterium]|nr:hypothetical protein [Candidatus Saccharibacteria bacterium]
MSWTTSTTTSGQSAVTSSITYTGSVLGSINYGLSATSIYSGSGISAGSTRTSGALLTGTQSSTKTVNSLDGAAFQVTSTAAGAINVSSGVEILTPTWSGSVPATANGVNITDQGGTGTTTSYGINIGASNGLATTKTALNIGSGWDTILSGTTAGTNLISFSNFSVSTAGTTTASTLVLSNAIPTITTSSASSNLSIDTNGTGIISIGSIASGDIRFAGGFGSSGCSITTAGALSCNGAITGTGGGYLAKDLADTSTAASAGSNLYSFQNTSTTTASNGLLVTTPAVSSSTPTITGISGTTGTLSVAGVQNAFLSTLGIISAGTANAYNVSVGSPTGGTINGFNFQNVSTTNASVNAINIGTESKTGSGTATAINIGTGWDNIISNSAFNVTGAGDTTITINSTTAADDLTVDVTYSGSATGKAAQRINYLNNGTAASDIIMLITNSDTASGTTERLLQLQNLDDSTVSEGILISSNNATGGTITNGLRFFKGGAGSFTQEILLQNGETISNAVDGTINFGTTTTLTNTGALSITGGTTLTLKSTGANAATLDSGTTGSVFIGGGSNAKYIILGSTSVATQTTINTGITTSNYGLLVEAPNLTSGSEVLLDQDGVTLTSGNILDIQLNQSSQDLSSQTVSGNLIRANGFFSSGFGTNTISGNFLNLARTTVQSAATLNVTGAVASFSNSWAGYFSHATDTSNILSLAQNDTSASGAVLAISNSGTGFDVLGTSSTWSVTKAGALTVASCTGCGGGGANWDTIGNPGGAGAIAFGSTVQTMDWASMDANASFFSFNFTNNGTSAGTDSGVVINNALNNATPTDLNTENLLLLQQLDTTATGTTVVGNALKID